MAGDEGVPLLEGLGLVAQGFDAIEEKRQRLHAGLVETFSLQPQPPAEPDLGSGGRAPTNAGTRSGIARDLGGEGGRAAQHRTHIAGDTGPPPQYPLGTLIINGVPVFPSPPGPAGSAPPGSGGGAGAPTASSTAGGGPLASPGGGGAQALAPPTDARLITSDKGGFVEQVDWLNTTCKVTFAEIPAEAGQLKGGPTITVTTWDCSEALGDPDAIFHQLSDPHHKFAAAASPGQSSTGGSWTGAGPSNPWLGATRIGGFDPAGPPITIAGSPTSVSGHDTASVPTKGDELVAGKIDKLARALEKAARPGVGAGASLFGWEGQ